MAAHLLWRENDRCTRPAFNLLYDRLGIQSLTCIAHFAGSPPTPKAQEHPEDPVTQMGSGPHVSHLTLPAWFPPCGSCDCLLSVPSPGQPRAREESILQLGTYSTGCAPVEWTVCNQTRPKHAGERDPHNAIQAACGKWCLCSFVCLWCEISHSINTVCGHSLICANRQSIRNITA